jgi:uncharacterized protein (DUF433 family)
MLDYTPQEAAVMSGVVLAAVQKAITAGTIPAWTDQKTRRRTLDTTALLALALVRSMPDQVRLSTNDAYRLLRESPGCNDIAIGEVVHIDAGKALAEVRRRLALYERARERIMCDKDVMGGAPTIRGTRITAQSLLGRLEDGDTVDTILEDYPYLDADVIEGAALYARAHPLRGRPPGKACR